MTISIIAAMGANKVIGLKGKMPWHLPADLKHFKEITLNKPVIMGRKTYQSIGKPLPHRTNIIISSDIGFEAPGCLVAHNPDDALKLAASHEEIMIIGGSTLYEYFLPHADRLYLTFIDNEFTGDTFFPAWDNNQWQEVSRESFKADENNPYDYFFVMFEKSEA